VGLRYRVLADSEFASSSPPLIGGIPLAFELAVEGGQPSRTLSVTVDGQLVKLASPIDGHSWATPWTTLDAEAPPAPNTPASTTAVGFAVSTALFANGCTVYQGPALPAVDLVVLVESVTQK